MLLSNVLFFIVLRIDLYFGLIRNRSGQNAPQIILSLKHIITIHHPVRFCNAFLFIFHPENHIQMLSSLSYQPRFPASEWNVTLSLENTIKYKSKCRAISFHKFFGAHSVSSCMDVLAVNRSKLEPDSHHRAELGVCADLQAPKCWEVCNSSSRPVGGPRFPRVRNRRALNLVVIDIFYCSSFCCL